jgi:hypothetical protein
MTVQTINIGNQVNDGLGDDLRTAFQKVNANFSELSAQLTVTVSDAPGTGVSLFKEKIGAELVFRQLVEGTNITLNDDDDNAVIISTPFAFTSFATNAGSIAAAINRQGITFSGTAAPGSTTSRKDIEVTAFESTISFKTLIPVTDILTSYDFGSITGEFTNALQVAYAAANIDFGTINLPGRLDLDCGNIVY